LAQEARLVILCLLVLVGGEETVTELAEFIARRQTAISQQLARLRVQNRVEARQDGKNISHSLARPEVCEILEALHRACCNR
jgi:DNA-binding transcriptional ArsR family regulator